MGRSRPIRLLFIVIIGLGACRSTRESEPLPVDSVEVRIQQYSGSSFRGPMVTPETLPSESFNRVVVEFTVLEKMPAEALDPVADHADLFLETGAGRVFLPASRSLPWARVGIEPDALKSLRSDLAAGSAGRTERFEAADGAVAPGTSAEFSLQEKKPVNLPHLRAEIHQALVVTVHYAQNRKNYILGFAVRQVTEPRIPLPWSALETPADEEILTEQEAASLRAIRREGFLLDLDPRDLPIVVAAILPSTNINTGGAAVAVFVTVNAPPTQGTDEHRDHELAIEAYRASQLEVARAGEDSHLADPIGRPLWSGLASAIDGLASPDRKRSALAYLSRETTAYFAEDLALAASEPLVDLFLKEIRKRAADLPRPFKPEALGLLMEQTAYKMAFEFLRTRDVPVGATGVILRHTGEVGRHSAMLQEIIEDATSLTELRTELILENLFFLQDGSPAARVRAYDWLTQMNEAPPDYDPLASRKERGDAIIRFFDGQKPLGSKANGGEE